MSYNIAMVSAMYPLLALCTPRQTQAASHKSPLVLVAWVAYSDWVISTSIATGVLNAQFGFLDFLNIILPLGPYCHYTATML